MFDLNATPIEERETVVVLQGSKATIYSSDFREVSRLDKLFEATKEDKYGKTYVVDKSCIRFKKEKTARVMSEEKRKAASERLKAAREKKKAKASEENNND